MAWQEQVHAMPRIALSCASATTISRLYTSSRLTLLPASQRPGPCRRHPFICRTGAVQRRAGWHSAKFMRRADPSRTGGGRLQRMSVFLDSLHFCATMRILERMY